MASESGTTRDRHYGHGIWNGKNFTIVDTGGYVEHGDDIFEQNIRQQVQIAVDEATVILLMVDCEVGLTAMDAEIAQVLRRSTKPILLVANKADDANKGLMAGDFYQLGLGDSYPIAAISGMGTGDLLDQVVTHLPEDQQIAAELPKIAIIGKPNVGKSSLLNALLGEERSIVTPLAGTTRDAIDTVYKLFGNQLILTDTAGIRKKAKLKTNIEFYSTLRSIKALEEADVCMIMIDAEKGLEGQDLSLLSLAHRYKKGIILLVNKWDLIEKDDKTSAAYTRQLQKQLGLLSYIPIIFISAINKQRIYQGLTKALEVHANRKQKMSTAMLNKIMLPVIEKYPPPAVKGKYIKIKYVTQLPTQTPVIAFFCNLPQYIQPTYQRYLENQLRKHFKLDGVPIQLVFRKK